MKHTKLSFGMVASLQSPPPFSPGKIIVPRIAIGEVVFEQPPGSGIGAVSVGSPCGHGGHGHSCPGREKDALDSARGDLPLVVAVNILDDFCEDLDIWNALFGEERLVAVRQADGQWLDRWGPRVPNGVWRGRDGPRSTLVSAVVVTHQLSPSNLQTRAVELIHNPWAARPLPAEALRLIQRSIDLTDGRIHHRDGVSAAEIVAVPQPWPVPDERSTGRC